MAFDISRSVIFFVVCGLVACTTACASLPAHSYLITRLRNRGPIPVSLDNPYLASNSLLDQESSRSAELKGFLERRGKPFALEVEKETFSPVKMALFYEDKREYFVAEQSGESWLIAGPFPMSSEAVKMLDPLMTHLAKNRVVQTPTAAASPTSAKRSRLEPRISAKAPAAQQPSNLHASAQSTAKRPPPAAKPQAKTNPPQAQSSSERSSIEQIVKIYGKSDAELSPAGDVVHYVINEGETLRIIARWYTLDADNAQSIANANNIVDPNKLNLGDSVVIPAPLARNKKVMNEEAFGLLKMMVRNL